MKKKIVALIPARKGSKRVVNKNMRFFGGKPLIESTINACKKSKYIDMIIVSTDCDIISEYSKSIGANIPFKRPEHLASDTATTDEVILHCIETLKLDDEDIVILLQPTSPLRKSSDIDNSIEILLNEKGINGVVSVCECEHSPLWSNTLTDSLSMKNFIDESILSTRSQDLPVYYRLNGAIFAYNVGFFKKNRRRCYSDEIKAYIMDVKNSIDIDTENDFLLAEFIINK